MKLKKIDRLKWFPFFPADYLSSSSVLQMSLEEQGAYVRLLCLCWTAGDCTLPSDPEVFLKLSGLSSPSALVRGMFSVHRTHKNRLVNKRLYAEYEKCILSYEKYAQAGKKSGETRRTSFEHRSNIVGTSLERCLNDVGYITSHHITSDLTLKKELKEQMQRGSAEGEGSAMATRKPRALPDVEWLKSLKESPGYKDIDIDRAFDRCSKNAELRKKPMTRARFLAWLNREDVPMGSVNPSSLCRNMVLKPGAPAARLCLKALYAPKREEPVPDKPHCLECYVQWTKARHPEFYKKTFGGQLPL